ncbi:MAG TPA: hypothetical protein VGM54_06480 [Chthoniobacter sp.]
MAAFFAALDQRREEQRLTWAAVAREMWEQSAKLNRRRNDHPISPSTIANMNRRGDTTCQHALFMLRWLGRSPEDFMVTPRPETKRKPLPAADSEHRLRWNLKRLYATLNMARLRRGATWRQAAARLACTPSQLTGLRTAKYATGFRLAMRICQNLHRPAADFVDVATW